MFTSSGTNIGDTLESRKSGDGVIELFFKEWFVGAIITSEDLLEIGSLLGNASSETTSWMFDWIEWKSWFSNCSSSLAGNIKSRPLRAASLGKNM
jgi:hypothetical protein